MLTSAKSTDERRFAACSKGEGTFEAAWLHSSSGTLLPHPIEKADSELVATELRTNRSEGLTSHVPDWRSSQEY